MKILKYIWDNILFFVTLFLLVFIPLYPKKPLLDIQHTWVYIRVEDLAVASAALLWIALVLFKKVKLKTPLTLPIFIFWIIGAVSTLHGVMLIFPKLSDVFSNVAFLSFIRRIEYLSVFFIAYLSISNKKLINYVIASLLVVLLLIVGYGLGQKFYSFPAYLTMNEEFAKGVPIRLSELSRVPSTFAGHYDLAAYLVLVIPIFVSLAFGFKNWFIKAAMLATAFLGFGLLFMTVSRVSFAVLLVSLVALLVLQKKKLITMSLLILTAVFLILSPGLLARFGNTLSEVDVLVDSKTGRAIGQTRQVPREYFKDRVILRQSAQSSDAKIASSSAILPYSVMPANAQLLIEPNAPTGESLPQGTAYINLPLAPIKERTDQYFFEKSIEIAGTRTAEARAYDGNYLVKRARAYDLSFTTRFQGEWPRTLEAFKRNIFLGSGYGSVSLAVDNNYLRILGESGLLGFISFASIFLISAIYIRRALPKVDSPVVRSFVLGFAAGTFGLLLNAILIDVFEASKVAFTFWILTGVVLGLMHLYGQEEEENLYNSLKRAATSPIAIVFYLVLAAVALFLPLYSYYFVGDDFTWLRWAAETGGIRNIPSYFTEAQGFFYRPGTRLYFFLMYKAFWLNQTFYHLTSIVLHISAVLLVFTVSRKIFKDYSLAIIIAGLFLVLSGYHEAVFWISSIGFLFNAVFALLALLSFIWWREKGKSIYFAACVAFVALGLLFQESAVVTPLLVILYDSLFGGRFTKKLFKKDYLLLFSPLLPYAILRVFAHSHWLSGDYSYSLFKLPLNVVGNAFGYFALSALGPQSLPVYHTLRDFLRGNILFSVPIFLAIIVAAFYLYQVFSKKITGNDRRIIAFGLLFFAISLLPFLGLGNISSRYSYLSSIGVSIILAFLLKKTWRYLVFLSDKYIAAASITMIVMVFVALQLFQLQKLQRDWKVSGEKSKRFLISFQAIYKDYWADKKMRFYFADVPIKNGEAWIFPVGLPDALWFTFDNKDFVAEVVNDLGLALDMAEKNPNTEVFLFDTDGAVREVVRIKGVIMVYPNATAPVPYVPSVLAK